MESHYATRIDKWTWIAVGGTFLLCGLLLYRAIVAGSLAGTVMMLAIAILLAAFTIPTRYTIGDEELVVRAGVLKSHIGYSRIRRVYRHWSVVASPAMSLDRLAIDYQRGPQNRRTVWISPRDQDRFMEELSHAAGLVRQGDIWIGSAEDTTGNDAR